MMKPAHQEEAVSTDPLLVLFSITACGQDTAKFMIMQHFLHTGLVMRLWEKRSLRRFEAGEPYKHVESNTFSAVGKENPFQCPHASFVLEFSQCPCVISQSRGNKSPHAHCVTTAV